MSATVYEIITEQILNLLEKGVVPWKGKAVKPVCPVNFATGRAYRGINVFTLATAGFNSPYWLTFNQVKEMGGRVKKGSKSVPVVFWKIYDTTRENEEGEEIVEGKRFVARYYRVFNAEQIEGIEFPTFAGTYDNKPIEKAESVWRNMPHAPKIFFDSPDGAYYGKRDDSVHAPALERCKNAETFYSTLFHELAHSTGAKHRLNRVGVTGKHGFGDEDYAQEELVAEMTAAFLTGHCGLESVVIEDQALYIQEWLKALRNDKKLVVIAAAQAQKAADYILGVNQEA